ncbi:MAG: hypothetical protein JWO05_1484 [Gemmatimonadetes bacterium]|nr:hypothetical protein [Gemmatimonadota bacterium]
MSSVSVPGWLFIAWMLIAFPLAAVRTARRVRASRAPHGEPFASRTKLYASTLALQAVLGLMAFAVCRAQWIPLIGTRPARELTAVHWLYGAGCLALLVLLAELSWRTRPESERKELFTRMLLPRSSRERALFALVILAAGTCEELAFRGALFQLLALVTGSLAAAAIICSVDFALVHYPQGARSMVTIFVMALLKHALVLLTGTLLVSMVVHVAYDLAASWRTARRLAATAA